MRKVNIITDSSNDLSKIQLIENEIVVLPFYVNFGEKSFRDGIDIDVETLYKLVNEHHALPKTSAVSPAQFNEEFAKYSKDEDVIYIGLGSGFSATCNNAFLASQEYDNVYVIDSQNLSTGIGVQLIMAAKYRNEGLDAKAIVEKVKVIQPLIKTQFAINTLEYLHMGGRCSSTSKFFGTLLNIKPIIRVIDGKMEATKQPIGFTKALKALLSYLDGDLPNVNQDIIFITHSLAEEDAQYLRKKLIKRGFAEENIIETRAGGTISTHCGPRTIGIIYLTLQ
jgi:DegV family protein with EDD domain